VACWAGCPRPYRPGRSYRAYDERRRGVQRV